ncbi:hypothetical protein ABK040_007855 [Willaertia magna]
MIGEEHPLDQEQINQAPVEEEEVLDNNHNNNTYQPQQETIDSNQLFAPPVQQQLEHEGDEPMFIFSVSEPEKINTGKTFELSYWQFKITVDTKLQQYKKQTLICYRRFNDFVWVRDQLVENYKGVIVPPLPEKSILASVEKIFSAVDTNSLLEYRQRALTKFLTRVGEHPVLATSVELQQFLEATEEEFNQIKTTKKSKSGFSLFKTKPSSAEPEWVTTHRHFVDKLDVQLKELRNRLQTMVNRRKEMAASISEFGKLFIGVGNVEREYDPNNSLSKNLIDIGQVAEKLGTATDSQAQKETMQVIETLTYYLGMCDAVRQTIQVLDDMRADRDSAQHQVQQIQQQKEKPNLKEEKKQQLEVQLEEAAQRLSLKNDRLTQSENILKVDLERFDLERKIDFSCMLQSFLNLQVEYNQLLHENWSNLIPQVNSSIYEDQ